MSNGVTRADFARATGVSRETLTTFDAYHRFLTDRSQQVNLVGANTLDDIWGRHFLDSAQIAPIVARHAGAAGKPLNELTILDVGSGAGFPGLVVAILLGCEIQLIESNGKKATFLAELAEEIRINVVIQNIRCEQYDSNENGVPDIMLARAVAPLVDLLGMASRLLGPNGAGIFLKGANWPKDIAAARKRWSFDADLLESSTNPDSRIIVARKINKMSQINRLSSIN